MRPPTRRLVAPLRLAGGAVALALLAVACGGGESDDAGDSDDISASADGQSAADATDAAGGQSAADATDAASGSDAGEEAAAGLSGAVDLGGPEVDPASDVETNLLPDLVIDDVSRGKKVNLRNLVPSETPVLLWMYAPH